MAIPTPASNLSGLALRLVREGFLPVADAKSNFTFLLFFKIGEEILIPELRIFPQKSEYIYALPKGFYIKVRNISLDPAEISFITINH